MKNYTVKELADKFSVTEMAIHKQLKHDKVKNYVVYESNRKFLTEKGLQALTTLRNDNQKYSSKAKDKTEDANTNFATAATETAKKATSEASANTKPKTYAYFSDSDTSGSSTILYNQLCKQLEIKDSQIADLTSLLGKQTDQVNLLTHTIKHMNGTLQLKEVSNITSDINDINDKDIKDIEEDIISKFGSAYTATPAYEDAAAAESEVTPDFDDVFQKAKQDIENIQNIINETPSASKKSSIYTVDSPLAKDTVIPESPVVEDAVIPETPIPDTVADAEPEEENDSSEIIISAKEKKEEDEEKEEETETAAKKGFWGKLFGKK